MRYDWKPAFLATLSRNANVRLACEACAITRKTAYEHRKQDAAFAKEWKMAMDEACDRLQEEATRRALETSDLLLIFLLKSHRPAIYRERYEPRIDPDDAVEIDIAKINPHGFAGKPVEYAEQVLKITTLTHVQKQALEALHKPPYKILCPSAHATGKTFAAAVAVNYWYDSFNPGVCITTAPTMRDVVDLLWTEVRLQRIRAGLTSDLAPKAPYMGTSEDHYAKGYTATTGESFQGRHRERMLFIFDEATGVDELYWLTFRTMFDPEQGHAALFIFNPTDTTSQAYREDSLIDEGDTPAYHRFRMSALDHPNIIAELAGLPRPVPGAVSLRMLEEWLRDWCEVLGTEKPTAEDILWPPLGSEGDAYCKREAKSRAWYRPGPIMQARGQGLWPTNVAGLWSDSLWNVCLRPAYAWPLDVPAPDLGVDCAQGKGDDYHAIHTRWGPISLAHESANTMDPKRIYERIKLACQWAADFVNAHVVTRDRRINAKQVRIKIDDDGTGNAISAFLASEGYHVKKVGAGTSPIRPNNYPRKRDELWFEVADRARLGMVCLSEIKDERTLRRLKQQLLAVQWEPWQGMRKIEKKDETKEKIGRSPDDADAFNLAYYEPGSTVLTTHEPEPEADKPQERQWGSWR